MPEHGGRRAPVPPWTRAAWPRLGEPGEAAHRARTRLRGKRVQSKLCQRRPERGSQGPAGPGGGAPCPEGSPQSARPSRTSARALATRSLTTLPPPATWSGAAPRRLGAARQPAHTHMRATERAARTPERARPPPPSSRTAARTLPGSARERELQAHCFPAALYLVARPEPRDRGAGPRGRAPPPAPPPAVDRWGRPHLLAGLARRIPSTPRRQPSLRPPSNPPPQINCTLASAEQEESWGAGQSLAWLKRGSSEARADPVPE